MSLYNIIYITVILLNFIISVYIIFVNREKPEKSIGWLLIFMLVPIVGLVLYFLVGRNWRSTNLKNKLSHEMLNLINASLDDYEGPYQDIAKLVTNGNSSPMFMKNEVKLYKDGYEKFNDLLFDLKNARHHIHMEYYIVKSDEIGRKIFDILKEKALEGIEVRFIMDKVGGRKFDKDYLRDLIDSGVEIVTYSAHFANFTRLIDTSINYRNHRKIVIIDGDIGYIGGNNIGDEYLGQSKFGYWRDTHMRIRGDFVLGLQGLFYDDFFSVININENSRVFELHRRKEVHKQIQDFEKYFPKTSVNTYIPMQLAYCGPASPFSTIEQLFIKIITSAREKIFISSPYFIPSSGTLEALRIAILSGVDVRIIMPEQYDHPPVQHASMTYIKEILQLGAKFYLYDKSSFIHTKAIVVDGRMFTMGTANFDVRSFYYNYEVNAVVYDELEASKVEGMFFDDIARSRLITLDEFNERGLMTNLKESFFRVFSLLF